MSAKNDKQIINSLKCCPERKCDDCFYQNEMDCMENLMLDALGVIDRQRELLHGVKQKIENGEPLTLEHIGEELTF